MVWRPVAQPCFGLSGAVISLGGVFPPLVRAFVLSIPTRFRPVARSRFGVTTPGLSTSQTVAPAMICSGWMTEFRRSERPTQAKGGLEWAPVRAALDFMAKL